MFSARAKVFLLSCRRAFAGKTPSDSPFPTPRYMHAGCVRLLKGSLCRFFCTGKRSR